MNHECKRNTKPKNNSRTTKKAPKMQQQPHAAKRNDETKTKSTFPNVPKQLPTKTENTTKTSPFKKHNYELVFQKPTSKKIPRPFSKAKGIEKSNKPRENKNYIHTKSPPPQKKKNTPTEKKKKKKKKKKNTPTEKKKNNLMNPVFFGSKKWPLNLGFAFQKPRKNIEKKIPNPKRPFRKVKKKNHPTNSIGPGNPRKTLETYLQKH